MDPGQPKEEPTGWDMVGGKLIDVAILGAVIGEDSKVKFIVRRVNHGSDTRMSFMEEIPTATIMDWVCSILGVESLPAVVSRTNITATAAPSHQGTGAGVEPPVAAVGQDDIEVLFEGPSVAMQKAQKEKAKEEKRAQVEAYGKRHGWRIFQMDDFPDSSSETE